MDGCFLAKDGERAQFGGGSPAQSDLGAPHRPTPAHSQGARFLFTDEPERRPVEAPTWVYDHEGVNQWLRSIPADDRQTFLRRIAANIDTIQHTQTSHLEPGCEDALLSYAILIEYAEHLGVSPMEVCWTFERESAEPVDALLGVRVDRMLADAAQRKMLPKRRGEDASIPARNRGLSSHWKATSSRRARDHRDDDRPIAGWASEPMAFHANQPGRAG